MHPKNHKKFFIQAQQLRKLIRLLKSPHVTQIPLCIAWTPREVSWLWVSGFYWIFCCPSKIITFSAHPWLTKKYVKFSCPMLLKNTKMFDRSTTRGSKREGDPLIPEVLSHLKSFRFITIADSRKKALTIDWKDFEPGFLFYGIPNGKCKYLSASVFHRNQEHPWLWYWRSRAVYWLEAVLRCVAIAWKVSQQVELTKNRYSS